MTDQIQLKPCMLFHKCDWCLSQGGWHILAVKLSPFLLTVSQTLVRDGPPQSGSQLGALWIATPIYPQPVFPSLLGQCLLSWGKFSGCPWNTSSGHPGISCHGSTGSRWLPLGYNCPSCVYSGQPSKIGVSWSVPQYWWSLLQRVQKRWYNSCPIWWAGSSAGSVDGSGLNFSNEMALVGYPRLTSIEECMYNYFIVHQDLGLCPQVSVSKDSVKQSPKWCTGTLVPVLNIIIMVHCLREVDVEVGKMFDSLQDFPIDGDLWVWANYTWGRKLHP